MSHLISLNSFKIGTDDKRINQKNPVKLIRFKITATNNPILITICIEVFASISLTKIVLLLVCYSQRTIEKHRSLQGNRQNM